MKALPLLALAILACEPTPREDAGRDDVLGDTSPEDALDETRLAAPVPYSARAVGLCHGAPADLSGLTVWVDAGGLHAAPHESASTSGPLWSVAFERDEVPSSPVVVGPSTAEGGVAVAVSALGPEGCRLALFAADGSALGEHRAQASSCLSPQSQPPLLAWPLAGEAATGGSGRIAWIDSRDAREVASLTLDSAPRTPLVILGRDLVSGGGSHWLVGTERGLDLIGADPEIDSTRPPRVVAHVDVPDGAITSLLASGTLAVATLSEGATGPDPVQLGARFALFRVASRDEQLVLTRLPDLTARSPLTAHPVLFDCRGVGDQPALCPPEAEAALIAGGAGWLGGWHLPSGTPAFAHETALTWSGLAAGRGGWVAGGGSHWLPSGEPEWRVVAVHPGPDFATAEIAREGGEACVPSPLWDTNGDLVVPVDGVASRLVRGVLSGIDGALGLADGSPRPLGDGHNASAAVRDAGRCQDGVLRALSAMPIDDEDLYALATTSRGVMTYGRKADAGVVHWLPDEGPRVALTLDTMNAVERALPLGDDAVVVAHFDLPRTGSASLSAYRATGERLWSHGIAADPGAILGLVPGLEGEYLVATRGGSMVLVTRIHAVMGTVEARAFFPPDDPIGLERFVADGLGGAVMVFDDDRLSVRRIDGHLGLGPATTWAPPSGNAKVVDATLDGLGQLRVLVEAFDGERTLGSWLVRFDRELALLDARPAAIAGYVATLADGDSLIQTEGGLARLSSEGAFGLVRPPGGGLLPNLHAGLHTIAADRDGFRVAFWRDGSGGRELVWGRADRLGFLACAEAGLCAGQVAALCDTLTPCTARGCLQATGECHSEALVPGCPTP
jgi:hypothetical protein